jgi:hypothetical protein
VAVARAGGRLRSLVAGPPEEELELVLDGPLEDEPRAQATKFTEPVRFLEPIEQGGFDRGLNVDAWGYSSIHGVVSFCGSATSALEPTPSSLLQRGQDATESGPLQHAADGPFSLDRLRDGVEASARFSV